MDEAIYREAEAAWWRAVGGAPTEHLLILDRPHVQVRVQAVGEGPPVLFVHGAATAGACFADLAAALPEYRCLLLDRPGCGLSEPVVPPPGLEGLPDLADALVVSVLDALRIDRAHVVSTSMGGYFALRAAAAHPDRIARVVNLGWSLGAPVAHLPAVMRMAGAPVLSRAMARVPITRGMARAMLRRVGLAAAIDAGRLPDAGIDWNVALANHTATRRNEYELARGASLARTMATLELSPDLLSRVGSPVLVLFGGDDPFGTTATMQGLVDHMPDARLEVLHGAGHAVWVDDLHGVVGRVTAFLSEDDTVTPIPARRTIVLDHDVHAERG